MLLEQFAKETGQVDLSLKLQAYVKAKSDYNELLDKYEVFGSKETSTGEAAKLVGLQLPKTYNGK